MPIYPNITPRTQFSSEDKTLLCTALSIAAEQWRKDAKVAKDAATLHIADLFEGYAKRAAEVEEELRDADAVFATF